VALSSGVRFLYMHEVYFASCPNVIPGFSSLNEFRVAFWYSRYADMFRLGAFTSRSTRPYLLGLLAPAPPPPTPPSSGRTSESPFASYPSGGTYVESSWRYRSLSASARAAQDSFSEGGIPAYMAEVYFASWPKVMPGLMALNWSRMAFWSRR